MATLHIACPKRADDPARHLDVHIALPLLIEAMGFVGEHFSRCVCGVDMLIIPEPAAPVASHGACASCKRTDVDVVDGRLASRSPCPPLESLCGGSGAAPVIAEGA